MKNGKEFSGAYGGKKPIKGGTYDKAIQKQKKANNPFSKPISKMDKNVSKQIEKNVKKSFKKGK